MFVFQWLLIALWVLVEEGRKENDKVKPNKRTLEEEQDWLNGRKIERERLERINKLSMQRKQQNEDQVWIAKQNKRKEDLQRRNRP